MEELLRQIAGKLDKLDSNVEKTALEVARIGRELDKMNARVMEIEGKVQAIPLIEIKVNALGQRLDNMDSEYARRFKKIEHTVATHEKRAAKPKKKSK
jgi:hypothetical protein